jgi:hypothetical protein
MVEYLEVGSWYRTNMDAHTLQGLVASGQLTANTDLSSIRGRSPQRGMW